MARVIGGGAFRSWRGGILTLAALCLTAGGAAAQSKDDKGDDLLEQTKRREQAASQKVEADVRAALLSAQKLSSTDKDKAIALLKGGLAELEDDTTLPDGRRESLKRVLKDSIRVFGLRNDVPELKEPTPKERDKEKPARGADPVRKTDDAPSRDNGPAAQAARTQNATLKALEESRRSRTDGERRLAGSYRDIDRSAAPPAGDVEYPKDWAEKTKRRVKSKVTVKEQAILDALGAPISVTFNGTRFEDALEYLRTATGQPIAVDEATLKDQGIDSDTTVNLKARAHAFRSVLRKLLGDKGLAYVVKDETIQIVTAEQARHMMTVRTYYLGDLVGLTDLRLGPVLGALQTQQMAQQIVDTIKSSVEPGTWGEDGGGTIVYEPRTMSIVVKQSAEVHSMLGRSLR